MEAYTDAVQGVSDRSSNPEHMAAACKRSKGVECSCTMVTFGTVPIKRAVTADVLLKSFRVR